MDALEIANTVAAVHKRYLGKGPGSVTVHVFDDVIAVVLREGLTRIERTLVDSGRSESVVSRRQDLDETLDEKLELAVAEIIGRPVEAVLSAHHLDPMVEVKVFVLARPSRD